MTPGLRKFVLTAHITSSVGWLGAVAGFLALAVAGLKSNDAQTVRAVYLAAEPLAWFVLVPLALTSLVIGVVNALGTSWGLFRHYWVLFKLVLTSLVTIILLQYTRTVSHFAGTAAGTESVDLVGLWSYVLHASGGLVVLLITTVLSVYKPQALTPYGRRKQRQERAARVP